MKNHFFILFCLVSLFSCQRKDTTQPVDSGKKTIFVQSDSAHYAQGFEIEMQGDYSVVKIQNPWVSGQTLQTYILAPKSKDLPKNLPKGTLIRTPLERTVCFTSVLCGFFNELGVLPTLVGAAEPRYIDIPYVQENVSTGKIRDIGSAANPNIEMLMVLEPEAIFINPIDEAGAGSLSKLNIPTIQCIEYIETHPLGQAEWIRFFGLLFDQKEKADSLLSATIDAYNRLKQLTIQVKYRPSVLTEKKYGDFWYMPGGKSYMANLLQDAGADYVMKNNPDAGSIPFSFETVLYQAEKSDYWLIKYYSPTELTYRQLAEEFLNYTLFDAYKKRQVYACNTLKTPYYQDLPLHPDWALSDLIYIFHPELLPKHALKYYHKLLN
ncbi:MAG: ABC transporter substrate-binding protein [Candidatus Azobacteroides sp.]|nr:ABC transporter substrate-binding protein [Candidatus Azobacteroides sp.]